MARGDRHMVAWRVTWCLRIWWSRGPVGRRLLLETKDPSMVTCRRCLDAIDMEVINGGARRLALSDID